MRGLSEDRGNLLLLWALGAVLALWYLGAEVYMLSGSFGFPLDDSWIHLAFARNLAGGDGLSLNPGELVTGSTAPLWSALLSLTFIGPASAVILTKALGTLLYLGGIGATYRLGRELGLQAGLATLAAALTAGTSWLVWSALSGMEIPLFILLSLWGMILHLRERVDPERLPLSLIVLAAASLARPEGQLLLLLAVADRLTMPGGTRSGRVAYAVRGLLLAALVIGPVLLFNFAVGGSVAPTTLAAKTGGASGFWPSVEYLYVVLGIWFAAQPVMTLLCAGGVAALVARWGGERDRGLLPALWLVCLPLAYSTMSPAYSPPVVGNFGRYFFPLFPVVIVLAVLAIEPIAERIGEMANIGGRRWLQVALLGLVAVPTVMSLSVGATRYAQQLANVEDSNIALARWLEERIPEDAVLAVNDIGAFKYMLPNKILDLAGIAHPEIREYTARAIGSGQPWQAGVLAFLEAKQPDYLVIFPDWFPALTRQEEDFQLIHKVQIPNNITMGADEIGVFTTPWTSRSAKGGQG